MRFIAHRGNTIGKFPDKENKPDYIYEALELGYEVEIDVWVINDVIYLGHDGPETEISYSFLDEIRDCLWCHAKNIYALEFLLNSDFNCFFHDTDEYTLTSKGFIWAYPGKPLTSNTICVMPEMCDYKSIYSNEELFENCLGICSDIIEKFRDEHFEYM
jgi:hypothetical protein